MVKYSKTLISFDIVNSIRSNQKSTSQNYAFGFVRHAKQTTINSNIQTKEATMKMGNYLDSFIQKS